MVDFFNISSFSLMLLLCISFSSNAQNSESDQILKNIYDNFESTTFEEQYEKLKDLLAAAKSENSRYNYNFALTNLSTYAYEMEDYIAFTEYTEEAYQHWQNEPELSRERIYYTATQAIVLESTKGNTKKALELYFIMLSELKKDTSTSEYLIEIYTDLASDSRSIGDLESAILYNQKALEIIDRRNLDDAELDIIKGNVESTQGYIYIDKLDFQRAINSCQKSIKHLKNYKDDFSKNTKMQLLIESYLGLAESFLKVNDLPQANIALNTLEDIHSKESYKGYHINEIRGLYLIENGDYEKGKELLEIALKEARVNALTNKEFPMEARITMRIGDGMKKNNDFDSALIYYHRALQFIDTTTSENLIFNPQISNVKHTKRAYEILQKKATTAAAIFQNNNKKLFFKIASNAYQTAILLLDKMKVNFLNKDTRHFIASNASIVYNEYIKLLADQYKESKNDELISMIYMIAEKNKSTIAFDELQYKYRLANAKIPDDLKQKHRDIKVDIAYAERLLNELKPTKNQEESSINKLQIKIFNLNEEFIMLDQKLNRDYADELVERESILKFPTMKDIQSYLKPDDLFIETFQSEDHYYFIVFDNSQHFFFEISTPGINDLLKDYLSAISTRPKTPLDEDHHLIKLSHAIYKATLQPILTQFDNKNRVFMVPDGLLSSIPFESLITDESNPQSFVILDYNITYLYASLQIMTENDVFNEVNVLSLAPQFEGSFSGVRSCDRDSLSSLPYAKKESEFLSELYTGIFLNSGEVKKSDLIDNINSHEIIHIATHACVNESNPMLNEIHFSDSYLTNMEIENQLASPELIVLGACNTANGRYIEGEGLLSLSKGFLQSGSKCIQASLWAIDDYASSEIIKGMFTNLKTGSTKSEALRNSKLSFLNKGDKLRVHPYFWAGIIQTGEDSALFEGSNTLFLSKYIPIALGLLAVIALFFFFKRRFF